MDIHSAFFILMAMILAAGEPLGQFRYPPHDQLYL
jgi:hypothetical protein